jgi:hypothetical protein
LPRPFSLPNTVVSASSLSRSTRSLLYAFNVKAKDLSQGFWSQNQNQAKSAVDADRSATCVGHTSPIWWRRAEAKLAAWTTGGPLARTCRAFWNKRGRP